MISIEPDCYVTDLVSTISSQALPCTASATGAYFEFLIDYSSLVSPNTFTISSGQQFTVNYFIAASSVSPFTGFQYGAEVYAPNAPPILSLTPDSVILNDCANINILNQQPFSGLSSPLI